MTKFSITTAIAGGLAAAVLALAPAAGAGIDRQHWLDDIQQKATVGAATSVVGNGR